MNSIEKEIEKNSIWQELELNTIHHWDCLELMKLIPDKSIDLVITDPPYFWIVKDDWDNQRETRQHFIDWLEECTKERKRILKDNWSLYIFWDDKVIAYVQVMIDKYLKLENSIVRHKPNNMTIKGWNQYRMYSPVTERLLFYSNWHNATWTEIIFEEYLKPNNTFSIYLKKEFKKAKVNNKEIAKLFPSKTWWLTWCVRNWLNWDNVITEEQYLKVKKFLNNEYLKKEYEYLKKEYEELRKEYEELRRPFNPASNYTDVWQFNIITQTESSQADHPTQKPIDIIKRIIDTSSKEWDIILDCFLWSWTTAVACKELWRSFIWIEKELKYVDIANKRLATTTVSLFS